jgi:hypothetical protein
MFVTNRLVDIACRAITKVSRRNKVSFRNWPHDPHASGLIFVLKISAYRQKRARHREFAHISKRDEMTGRKVSACDHDSTNWFEHGAVHGIDSRDNQGRPLKQVRGRE